MGCQACSGIEQRLRFPQIERIETFGEPAVDRSKQFARLLHLALVAPEPRRAHCRMEYLPSRSAPSPARALTL